MYHRISDVMLAITSSSHVLTHHQASIGFSIPITSMFRGSIVWKGIVYATFMALSKAAVALVVYFDAFIRTRLLKMRTPLPTTSSTPELPTESVHQTALIVACAMIARGEIGYLIASLAQSSGALELKPKGGGEGVTNEDVFLVIVWAVTLCTIGGPVAVGTVVRGMKKKLDAAQVLPSSETGTGNVNMELEGIRKGGQGKGPLEDIDPEPSTQN